MILMFVHACVKVMVGVQLCVCGGVLGTETSVNNYIHHKNEQSKVGQNESVCPSEKMPLRSNE